MFCLPDKEMVVFDLETTDHQVADAAGVVPDIVEVGALHIDRHFEILGKFETLVCPSNLDSFTEFSEELTGIRRKDLETAPSWSDVCSKFTKFTRGMGLKLCSWGIGKDIATLESAYKRRRIHYPHNYVTIDALSIMYGYCMQTGVNVGGWGLRAACSRFNVQRKVKHRALPDALAVVHLFKALADLCDEDDTQTDYKIHCV
jgi:DNA polymerase III epsilon subunit-like protein